MRRVVIGVDPHKLSATIEVVDHALPKIERVAREEPVGFWHVYRDGKINRMWP